MTGGAGVLRRDFAIILDVSTSHFDITSVSSFHMLLLGLCFGIKVSGDPVPNSEAVEGRPDIQLVPERALLFDGRRPLVTIELGFVRMRARWSLMSLSSVFWGGSSRRDTMPVLCLSWRAASSVGE